MSTSPVPMFDPQGTLRDVPYEQVNAARQAGGEIGVRMQAPDGTVRVVPASRYVEASQQGGKVLPIEQQAVDKPGFWSTLGSDLGSLFSSTPRPIPDMAEAAKVANVNEKAAGHGLLYRTGAAAATGLGANVPAMEQAAEEGNPAAVLGHAAAGAAPYAVGAGIGAATEALGPAAEDAMKARAQEMYQSALKPSTRLNPVRVEQAINTGLEAGIPVSEAGAEKLSYLIDDLNNKIKATIPQGTSKTVSRPAVTARLDDVRSRFANQVSPTADLNAVNEVEQDFRNNQPLRIPADQAQTLKQGTYQQLGSKAYGEMKTAAIEAQKALARGIKEELVQQFPELKNLNDQESKFLNLDPLIEKAVQRIGNHQLIGIGTPMMGTAAGVVTGSKGAGAVAALIKMVVDNPAVKSRLAIALNRAGVTLPSAIARVGSYSVGLGRGAKLSISELRGDQTNESAGQQ